MHECRSTERRGIAVRQARRLRGAPGQRGDTTRVAAQERRLQVDEVRHRSQRTVEVVDGERQHGFRLGVEDRRARVIADLIDLGPLVAGAGIVGIALGFGAQNLVRDFLSGIFMLIEDQYGVGDVINAGTASGTVEA